MISEGGSRKSGASISSGHDGSLTAVWIHTTEGKAVVESSSKPAGQDSFSAPARVATLDSDPGNAGDRGQPQVVTLPDGSATVAWCDFDGSSWVVKSARRSPGQSDFSGEMVVSGGPGDATFPRLACSPHGDVSAAWERVSVGGNVRSIEFMTLASIDGKSTEPTEIWATTDEIQFGIQLLSDGQGLATVIWDHRHDARDSSYILAATSMPGPGERWTECVVSDPAGDPAFYPCASLGPDGAVAVVWRASFLNLALRAPTAGTFSKPIELSREGGENPAVALGPEGSLAVVWEDGDNPDGQTAIRAALGRNLEELSSTKPSQLLTSSTGARSPRVAVAGDGEFVCGWLEDRSIQTATARGEASTFSEPTAIPGTAQAIELAGLAAGPRGTSAIWISDEARVSSS